MPTMFAHHEVKDQEHWLAATTRQEFFGGLGVTNIREFVDPTNPARVGILMDVPDPDALAAALATPEAGEAEDRDGVIKDSLVILVEA